MERTELNNVEYNRLLGAGYKYIELNATGEEVETSEDHYKKVVELTASKVKTTTTERYVLEIDDSEVVDMVHGSDTDIFYIKRG